MKPKTLFYMALTAVMTTLAACSQDDEPLDAAPKPVAIEFEITDGGYGGDEATRAVEEGFRTKFEAGDECGLYIIDNGEFKASNVKLTAEAGENGEITWKAADGAISNVTENSKYFLYYPYDADAYNRVSSSASGDKDTDFFAGLISNWSVYTDQSTYDKYTASDLMTATGTVSTGVDGKLKVSFSLTHQMALAVIEVPKTVYKFTNTDVAIPDYTVPTSVEFTVGDSYIQPLRMEDGTYRRVVNPTEEAYLNRGITGTVNGSKKFTISADKLKGIEKGTYKTFRIGGADATIEKEHTLQVGDYLMNDGNLISKDETLSEDEKANVAAIVFWSPAETAADGRTTPASLTDDKIMAAEHPNCTHGLAVAVKELSDGNSMAWQTSAEGVQEFQSSDNFTHANKDKFVSIASGTRDNINKILGYQNTQVLLAYNEYCASNDNKTINIVMAAAALAEFANSNPAPTGSTGWFLPSMKELHMLYYKDVDAIYYAGSPKTETCEIVKESLNAVSGKILSDSYWSSSEYNHSSSAFYIVISNAQVMVSYVGKSSQFKARAVLAF